jgi:hypothetical protein
MMVVPVLMTSCYVSLNPNIGPVTAHTRMTATATTNETGRPVMWAVHLVSRVNQVRGFVGRIVPPAAQSGISHYVCFSAGGPV